MELTEDNRKHLEFLQNIIARLNTNSFQIKGLSVTLVTGLLAVYATTPKALFLFIGILPTFFFWFLDSYYLQQERKFRGIYNDVTGISSINKVTVYQMPVEIYETEHFTFQNAFSSKTVAWLYGSIIGLMTVGGLIAQFKDCL